MSRVGRSRWSGGSIHCGRISAASDSTQQAMRTAMRPAPLRAVIVPLPGTCPVRDTSVLKKGTRNPARACAWGGTNRYTNQGRGSSSASQG